MSSKLTNKTFKAKIKQDYDIKEGYFYYIELPNEVTQELHWEEDDKLSLSVKMGHTGNVIVVNKA